MTGGGRARGCQQRGATPVASTHAGSSNPLVNHLGAPAGEFGAIIGVGEVPVNVVEHGHRAASPTGVGDRAWLWVQARGCRRAKTAELWVPGSRPGSSPHPWTEGGGVRPAVPHRVNRSSAPANFGGDLAGDSQGLAGLGHLPLAHHGPRRGGSCWRAAGRLSIQGPCQQGHHDQPGCQVATVACHGLVRG